MNPSCTSIRFTLVALLTAAMATASALENDIRLVPELALGTSGLEPGFAIEVRTAGVHPVIVRPELLLSEDGHLGVGGALLVDISPQARLANRQALAVGPRIVYHNANDSSWEADAMATWAFDLSDGIVPWRQSVGALAALGLLRDPEHEDYGIGLTAGVFYAYRL